VNEIVSEVASVFFSREQTGGGGDVTKEKGKYSERKTRQTKFLKKLTTFWENYIIS